jgi:hypothetical protein
MPTDAMVRRATSIATQKFSTGGRKKEGGYKQRPITLAPVTALPADKPRGRS